MYFDYLTRGEQSFVPLISQEPLYFHKSCRSKHNKEFPEDTLCGLALDALDRASPGISFYLTLGMTIRDQKKYELQ
jgi:hypothetical protein